MRIFLDDERYPKVEQFDVIIRDARSFFDRLIDILQDEGTISYISFDHDLGLESQTGYDCAKMLVTFDETTPLLAKDFTFNVHSANPVGAKNIQMYLDQYLRIARDGR